MSRPAAFIDRDGTIIEELEYLSDPERVRLLPGAAEGLRGLAAAGYLIVVITNQSGMARGLFGEAEFQAVQERLHRLLADEGVAVDAVYHCPHHPQFTGPCECRKPGTGLFRQAMADLDLDPARSIYVGDRLRDVAAAAVLGGRAYLVRTGYGSQEAVAAPAHVTVVADLRELAEAIAG